MARKQHKSQERLGPFTMIYRNRWRERSFTQGLPWNEKAMLFQLESSDVITAAGVVRADAEILAQKHPDQDASNISDFLKALEDKDYIRCSGTEIFVRAWFMNNPIRLRTENHVKTIIQAVAQIGYDDLREEVVAEFFRAVLEVAKIDSEETKPAIKRLCTALAEEQDVALPAKLRTNGTLKKD